MSRLDSAIRRLEAQCACLERAVALVRRLPGPVLELGFGHGRTYDHLRELCPEREIFVFEQRIAVPPECMPDAAHLVLGDIRETLPAAAARFAPGVPLVHSDIGTGDAAHNAEMARFLAGQLQALLRPGGIVVSDQDVGAGGGLRPMALPAAVPPGRYFMFQAR